jgi:hypothetical protein
MLVNVYVMCCQHDVMPYLLASTHQLVRHHGAHHALAVLQPQSTKGMQRLPMHARQRHTKRQPAPHRP